MTALSPEAFSKWVAAVAAVSYGIGFIATNSALARFGLSEPTLLASKYLSSGLSYLIITILTGIGWIAVAILYDKRLKEAASRPDRRLPATSLLVLLLLSFAIAVGIGAFLKWLIAGEVSSNWRMQLLWMLLNFAGCATLALGLVQRSAGGKGGIAWPIIGLVLIIYAADLFGRELYRIMPAQFGGSEMRTAQLIVKKEDGAVLESVGIRTYGIPTSGLAMSQAVVLIGADSSSLIVCASSCLGPDPVVLSLRRDQVVGVAE